MKNLNNINNSRNYMSLSKIAYGYKLNPKWAADKWLSDPSTLEYIQLWESLNNLDFEKDKYINLCTDSLSVGTSPLVEELQNICKVKSLFIDKNYDRDIYLIKELAIDFATWISPAFRSFRLCLLNDSCYQETYNFKSEEDLIITNKTLAKYSQQKALQMYKKEMKNLDKNFKTDFYSYYMKSNLK